MSFTGDLEHLPIVDIIQLLQTTRKSGILRVKSRKGESDLVFKDGYIVSASHLNDSVRIGTILIERNIITPKILDQTLLEQKNAGAERKPLIISLLDKGLVKEEDAYQGLEHLIEMTIIEILTWKRGTFTLDVLPDAIADEYRYYPGKINGEIKVDAQGVLMDALCIFDEKMRDGELTEEETPKDDGTVTGTAPDEEDPALSADDPGLMRLGLEDLEREEKEEEQVPVQGLGWGSVLVGLVVLACGVKGLYDYGQMHPAADVLPEIEEPPGPFRLYLTNGLRPTLQALLGMYTAMAGSQFLKMRPGARKGLEAAAWSGIAFAVASELVNLIASIRRASSSPAFWYCLVDEFIRFILMATFWTVPLLSAVWYLQRVDPAADEEPPGPFMLYLTHSLRPALRALLGKYTAMAGSQFLKMRAGARKGLEAAAAQCYRHIIKR